MPRNAGGAPPGRATRHLLAAPDSPPSATGLADIVTRAEQAQLLDISNERDLQLSLRHADYHRGYLDGGRDKFSAGYSAAIEDVKAAEHGAVDAIRLACARSGPAGSVWLAAVVRNAATEFGGAGQPRVPVLPEVIARVWQEQGRTAP